MVCETPKREDQLLPKRHPQMDLFICDVADAALKDVMPQMEHPFYSLSKKPETTIRRYEHKGNWIEVIPSVKGLATIYDKDILIYCISQIVAAFKKGEKVSRRVRINSRDLLIFTNRGTAGKDYMALSEALSRLAGTNISTNIMVSEDEEEFSTFSLVDAATVRRKHGLDGRLLWCEVTISDWVFDAIRNNAVLSLHPDYFRLRKPIERRLYELARKHCGQQPEWRAGVALLHKKSGSKSELKEFRRAIRHLANHDHLPDYSVVYQETDDMVVFTNRGTMPSLNAAYQSQAPALPGLALKPESYEQAREVAPGWDVYHLESKWREWTTKPPRNPDAAFVGFCRKWFEKRGHP